MRVGFLFIMVLVGNAVLVHALLPQAAYAGERTAPAAGQAQASPVLRVANNAVNNSPRRPSTHALGGFEVGGSPDVDAGMGSPGKIDPLDAAPGAAQHEAPEDERKLRLKAREGHVWAQYKLASLHMDGKLPESSAQEAFSLYRMAARQGDEKSQNNVGLMYLTGHGVEEDFVMAHVWLSLAARGGDERSIKAREVVRSKMTPQQIDEASRLLARCAKTLHECR